MSLKKAMVLIPIGLFLLMGCNTKAQKPEQAASEAVIKAGETVITLDDLNRFFGNLPEPQRQQVLASEEHKKMLIDRLVDTVVLAEAARQEKMNENEDFIYRRKLAENQILAQLYYEQNVSKKTQEVKVTDEEAKQYYDQNTANYSGGQVKASHILVKTMDEAQKLYRDVKAAPAKFEEIAKANSICPSAPKGGDLGWFGRGRMVKEFEDVAFAMEKGAIHEPIETRFGVHIIRLDDKTEITQKSFDEVKEQIKATLLSEKQEKWLKEFFAEQKKKLGVEVNEKLIAELGKAAAPPLTPPAPPSEKAE